LETIAEMDHLIAWLADYLPEDDGKVTLVAPLAKMSMAYLD
jgi:hypothetical protein